jgi:hypothetical protein
MSTTMIAPVGDAHAERWRQWQLANAEGSRKSAVQARIVFTVIFVALTGWLGLVLSAQLGI